ncbi:MAG: hypothetical protein ABJE95_14590 [Byssovorax sp.]
MAELSRLTGEPAPSVSPFAATADAIVVVGAVEDDETLLMTRSS